MPPRPIDMARLLTDQGIHHEENGRGWLVLDCPICDDVPGGHHLGWSGTVFSCFRCGRLGLWEVLPALFSRGQQECAKIVDRYRGGSGAHLPASGVLRGVLRVKMPHEAAPMTDRHKGYLKRRGFDPARLEREWGLLGTGPTGIYAHRIIIPIHDRSGRTVSWQARSISDAAKAKYLSCPDDKAAVPVKDCLYGIEKVPGDTVVIVEGPTKVWRLGPGAVATMGATVTSRQVKELSSFRRRVIMFDADDAGRAGTKSLAQRLAIVSPTGYGTLVVALFQNGESVRDAADLTDIEAGEVMKEFLI